MPRIPTLIPIIPTLIRHISRIPTLIPRIPTLVPCIPIIPFIPFPDSPFRLLQIATNKVFERKYINHISEVAKTSHSFLIGCHTILKDFL